MSEKDKQDLKQEETVVTDDHSTVDATLMDDKISSDEIRPLVDKWEQLKTSIPNLLFIIEKSINENIVVYETSAGKATYENSSGPTKQEANNPSINAYWLDLDPITKQEKEKKGITGERSELSGFEKYFAYGFQLKSMNDNMIMTLAACPQLPIYLMSNKETLCALATIDNVTCRLESIFVNMTGPVFMPTVSSIVLRGTHLPTNEKKTFIMNNEKR
jgi:hypothetical protein